MQFSCVNYTSLKLEKIKKLKERVKKWLHLLPCLLCHLGSCPPAQSLVSPFEGELAEQFMSTWISSMWQQEADPKDIWLPLGMA